MNDSLKKFFAVLILVVIVFGWFITLKGIPGVMDPIKDKLQLGLDIKGGVYVVLEAQETEKLTETEKKRPDGQDPDSDRKACGRHGTVQSICGHRGWKQD